LQASVLMTFPITEPEQSVMKNLVLFIGFLIA